MLWAVEIAVVRSRHFAASPDLIALAASIDLTLLVTGLYALLVIRPGHAPALSAIPVFLVGLLGARALLPEEHRGALGALELAALLAEAGMLGLAVWRGRAIARAFRVGRAAGLAYAEALEQAATPVLGSQLAARLLATEMSVLRYAALGWFERAPRAGDGRAYTCYRESGWHTLAGALALLLAAETVILHLVLARYTAIGAWIATAASLYSLAWLCGDLNSLRLDPTRLDDKEGALLVRVGLRWRARIPYAAIAGVELHAALDTTRPGALDASVSGGPIVVVTVAAPQVAWGPLGIRRDFTHIGLSIDDAPSFREALLARIGRAPAGPSADSPAPQVR
ncbi:hypothetical protein AB3662_39110 [Sorangium cellulosum]|uniref:hypothetical protein n=1 Tax=Sorangium cellulosum TaxID=56 RepID=UPI003D9A8CE0